MQLFQGNGLWNHTETNVNVSIREYLLNKGKFFPQIAFTVTWQRKPLYYLVNIMMPCIFLLSIALLVFWLPPDAGEKVSLSVTVLLAFSVFQVVIAANTPKNSEKIPVLSKYCMPINYG